ncbi:hypothetical protein BOSE21B_111394 [Bosea sp. 21B]|nr:hypothetical protein BOSE21B_111394 [Bosea sp. 21B]
MSRPSTSSCGQGGVEDVDARHKGEHDGRADGDKSPINPRPRNLAYASPRPARTEGASRGIMRPGGRAVFRGERALRARTSPGSAEVRPTFAIRSGSFHREGVFVDGRGPPSPAGRNTRRELVRKPRAGLGQWPVTLLRHSTSTFGTQPSTATPPDPAPPSDGVSLTPSRRKLARGSRMDVRLAAFFIQARVVPGDRRETRDPFRNLYRKGSGMDPGSARLRRLSGMTRALIATQHAIACPPAHERP